MGDLLGYAYTEELNQIIRRLSNMLLVAEYDEAADLIDTILKEG